jgi:DNA-binding SARP family transcriptional activator/tetratricopeptide (TPR) repeat protein
MAHLSITFLGNLQVTLDGQPIAAFKSNKDRALLAYLSVESERQHRREVLAGLFWPDWPDREALSNLRFTLSSLRKTIGDQQAQPPHLLITRDTLQFNPASDAWLDVSAFTQVMDACKTAASAVEKLEQAVSLYQGNFLEGFSLSDCPAFEEWILLTRERLGRQVSSALHVLASTCEANGDYRQAQVHTWRLLELEPWNETAHQQMMRILAFTGQRSAALAQFQICRRALADGLDVEPGQETTRLYEQIRDGKLLMPVPAPLTPDHQPASQPFFLKDAQTSENVPVFVARERELKQLEQFLEQALAGQGRVAFVTGESGSGKSLLLQEFTRRAEQAHPGLVIASGDCNAYTGIGDPYLPFREILGLLSGDVEARGNAGAITRETGRRLWNLLPCAVQAFVDSGPDLIDTFVPRAALLERASAFSPVPSNWLSRLQTLLERKPHGSSGAFSMLQADLFEQYTRVLQALEKQNPLLLVLDDLQWADVGSISLLFHLGRRLAGCRILVLGAYRPEEIAPGKDGGRHALEPVLNEFRRTFGDMLVNMDQAEGRDFIDAFLDSEPNRLGNSFRSMLYNQTLGQPLFTIELLRGLQERGDLVRDEQGAWDEGPSLDWETLPIRVEAAIQERIDRLPLELQRTLSLASVEGEIFTAEALARVQGFNARDLLQRLSGELDRQHHLIRAESIQRLGEQSLSCYRFRHILFQKYLYGLLDEVERVHLHEQVGIALESLYRVDEHPEMNALQLARHFEQARITEKAIHYLHMAGERATELSAYQDGVAHISRGLELLESLPDNLERAQIELTLQLALGKALRGDIPGIQWGKAINRARELCRQTGREAELCRVLGELSISYYVKADYRKACELAEESLGLAQKSGDALLIVLNHWFLGFILFGRGEYASAREYLGEVTSFYDPQQHHQAFLHLHGADAGVSALAYEACCLWCLGFHDQASQRSQAALSLARQLGHTFSLVDVLAFSGCLFNMMRRDAQALKSFGEELMRLSQGMGFTSFSGTGACYYGCALIWLGEIQEGIRYIKEGFQTTEYIASWCHKTSIMGVLGEALAASGEPEQGLATLDKAIAMVDETGECHWAAYLYIQKSHMLLAGGDEAGAEDCLQKAIETARRQQARAWELQATNSLCRLWQKQGKQARAKKALAELYGWFTEGFDTPDLVETRNLLKELK